MNATLCPRHVTPFVTGPRPRPWLRVRAALVLAVVTGSGATISPSGEWARTLHFPVASAFPPGAAVAGCGGGWGGSVGANFGKDNRDGRLFVREVPPDMAAARAGLRAGDEVVAIDGKRVDAMTADEVDRALRGPVGSTVTLSIVRRGEAMDVKIERGPWK